MLILASTCMDGRLEAQICPLPARLQGPGSYWWQLLAGLHHKEGARGPLDVPSSVPGLRPRQRRLRHCHRQGPSAPVPLFA